jgi:hypothetical protein
LHLYSSCETSLSLKKIWNFENEMEEKGGEKGNNMH